MELDNEIGIKSRKMRKRYGCLLIILLMFGGILISFIRPDKLYYIPKLELYLKIITPYMANSGYIVFSRDSLFSFSEEIDYVKVSKVDDWIRISVDTLNKDRIILYSRFNYIKELNQRHFLLEQQYFKDSIIIDSIYREDMNAPLHDSIQSRYVQIYVTESLNSVLIEENEGEDLKELIPMK